MNAPVYHYTDTARLPWILQSGELRPGRNRLGGFPAPDFLWATASALGDRTASANVEAYRKGRVRFIRFTLPGEMFEPWREIVERFPDWTPQQAARLEHLAFGRSDPRMWRCRVEPVPAERWLAVETRAYTDNRWRPLPDGAGPIRITDPFGMLPVERMRGVRIGSKTFVSTEFEGPGGSAGYLPDVLEAGGGFA